MSSQEQLDRSKCRPGAAGQVEMSWSSWIIRNVVPEQLDTLKCRLGAAGQAEMSSLSSWTGRNVVLDRRILKESRRYGKAPEHALDRKVVPEQLDTWKFRPRAAGYVLEQLVRSKCRPAAAGQVKMSSRTSWIDRNVVPEQLDTSKCRLGAAGQVEMSSWAPNLEL